MPTPAEVDCDRLIGLVYQGTLEKKPWQSFLPQLRVDMDAYVVSLVLRPPAAGDKGLILNCRQDDDNHTAHLADPNDWEAMAYQEQFFAIDPFVNLPPEQIVTQQELIPDEELLQSEYYRNYLQPIGLFHILGVDTVEPDGMIARLRIARQRGEPAFSQANRNLCARLLPHLRRAIAIHARLYRAEAERDLYAGTVDQLAVASILLDESGQVTSTNDVADEILAQQNALRVSDGRLRITDRTTDGQLQGLIDDALAARRGGELGVAHALAVSRQHGQPDLGLVVRPLPAADGSEIRSSPALAVFISDPAQPERTSMHSLVELFGLTPAEANLALKLARGLSLAAVCAEQNISQHTARAQLKSVFAKTGVTRQAELVRLILRSVANLG
jgi:DNA-binding CsgD family transcriptional regulator